jgi:hypothetical protein
MMQSRFIAPIGDTYCLYRQSYYTRLILEDGTDNKHMCVYRLSLLPMIAEVDYLSIDNASSHGSVSYYCYLLKRDDCHSTTISSGYTSFDLLRIWESLPFKVWVTAHLCPPHTFLSSTTVLFDKSTESKTI